MPRNLAIALLVGLIGLTGCGVDPPPDNGKANNTSNNTTGDGCVPGERTCQDINTLATCARSAEGTPRLVTTACLDTEECRDGDCVELPRDCSDLCTPPETRCIASGEVETCADHNGDGCVEFGGATSCDAGQVCDPADGLCKAPDCSDACAEGTTSCEGELLTTCSPGAGGCLVFGQGKECPDGQLCMGSACQATTTCTDECMLGEFTCTGDGQRRECRSDVDADTCSEYADSVACPGGQTCRMGECVAVNACQDQCIANERVCLGNEIATCETQADGCLAFSAPVACPGSETCQNMGGGNVMCQPVMMSGKVVINEVFYDAVGEDLRASGSPTFIELLGPSGYSVAGYTIELVNGSGGAVYGSFTLPAGAQLDGNGYAVIVTDQPDSLLGLALPFFTNVYDILVIPAGVNDIMQNGPDSVRLLDAAAMAVDAVGYGDFTNAVFAGEGNAAPDVTSGHSVGRKNGADTDDNAADFLSYIPTPGFENSDLIINEIYFDQPGSDDGSETFVEIINPAIQGWEDLPLDGYVLRAVNGLNGTDYIMSGVLPGIDMSGYNLNDGDEDGYVVICNVDTVGAALLNKCTVLYEGVDFQNGPDNFVLEYNGRVIDAVGYGSFSGSDVFVGEGMPRAFSTSSAGKSLARWPFSDYSRDLDTDSNSVDFHLVQPTPGAENPLP